MANANLNLVTTSNTFGDWLNLTDNEANTINELRNGNFYKDNGNFTVANGAILIISTVATGLSVTTNAIISGSLTVSGTLTAGGIATPNAATYANGTSVVQTSNVNFNNTASVNVSATANGSTQANIAFNINTSMNLVSLNVSGNIANAGNVLVSQNVSTGNIKITQNSSVGNVTVTQNVICGGTANIVQPTLVATRELLVNAATINSPNTYTVDVSVSSDYDITLGNTQFNSVNLTFTNWAQSGNLQTIVLILRQPGPNGNTSQTSSNVVNWVNTANIFWSNGEVPVLAAFKGKADILTFTTVDGGNKVYGAHSMANVG